MANNNRDETTVINEQFAKLTRRTSLEPKTTPVVFGSFHMIKSRTIYFREKDKIIILYLKTTF
jgi:hypothetical protein